MAKNVLIIVLLIAVWKLGAAVVRLERYHYADLVGRCSQFDLKNPLDSIHRQKCLMEQETRTHWVWHIYYALTD